MVDKEVIKEIKQQKWKGREDEGLTSCQFPYYNQKNSSKFGEQVI